MTRDLEALLIEIRACRACRDSPAGARLPHEPRPVLRASAAARIAVCGQAPGTRVHASGVPFTDPSGVRLRAWMGVSEAEFYDTARISIIPMGFCFPGLDAGGADRPPRPECAPLWRDRLFELMPAIDLLLLVGGYAHRWHWRFTGDDRSVGGTVADWRAGLAVSTGAKMIPLPHPSWRNNAWLKRNPWFEAELLPVLRREVRGRL